MSLAIDAVILFAAILIIWSGACKGFIRSVMGLLSTAASLIAAYAYTPALADYINKNYIIDNITKGISETHKSLAFDVNTGIYNLERLAVDLDSSFTDILERYGIEVETFAGKLVGLTSCSEELIYSYAEEIASPASSTIASAISFIIIFIAVFLVLSLVTALLDLIFKLPVLKTANMFFGFVFGAVQACVFVSALALLISVLVTALGSIDPDLFGAEAIDKSIICKYLIEHNIFTGMLNG